MKILLAIDESKYSTSAIKEVAKRPWPKETTVRVHTVAEPFPLGMEPWYGGRKSDDRVIYADTSTNQSD